MKQHALTLIAEVKRDHTEPLRRVLKEKTDVLKASLRTIGSIHYCRWVIIDEKKTDTETWPAQLAFSSNFDGDIEQHLHDLTSALDTLLDDIYTHCAGYSSSDRMGYFRKIRVKEMAFYQGSPGRSVKTIAQEKALHEKLLALKNEGHWEGQSAISVHRQLQQAVFSDVGFAWAKERIQTPGINWPALVLFGLVMLPLLPVLILWAIYIQIFFERHDKPLGLSRNQLDDDHITRMQLDEDFTFQNQFSQIIDMKEGKSRLITVNVLYLLTRILINIFFVKGNLMGIPTIHFARWVMVNDNKRMLFFSNFDGSWTQYLGDFIDKSGWGLTGIFGNTKTFPRSFLLILKGAYDQQKFLAWSRNTQIATQFWYVDDASLSIKNINHNTLIRNALSRTLNEKQASLFLSRI